jgi:hypothetical protein
MTFGLGYWPQIAPITQIEKDLFAFPWDCSQAQQL